MTTPTSAQGELFLQLQQLQDEVSRLRGMVEEQQYEIRQLKQESLDRYKELDGRLSGGQALLPRSRLLLALSGLPAQPLFRLRPAKFRRAVGRPIRKRKSCITTQLST